MAVGMYEERHLQTDDGIDFIEIAKTEEMEAEEDYEFPLWAGMIICVIFAIICVVMVFYFSYKHEQRKRPEDLQKKDPRVGQSADYDIEKSLPTKKWENDYDYAEDYDDYEVKVEGFCGLKGEDSYAEESDTKKDTSEESFSSTPDSCCKSPEELLEKKQGRSSAGNRSRVNSGHSVEHLRELGLPVDDMRWQELLSNPRCVLCSKVFDCGEDIAHSNNPKCSHEYHIECLTKYWAKNKTDNCPVCKQKFIVEEHTA